MTDFLLEIRSEEIPARMQAKARADLEKLFKAQIGEAGLNAGDITVYSTPRRLALIARDLPDATEAVSEEAKGPPEGAPDQAVDGFCRKNGVSRDELELRDVKGRKTYFAVINRPGRASNDVLAETVPAIIRAFPWPKSQRWGAASSTTESLKWVRPLSGIVALFGNAVVDCEIGGVKSGATTIGHRFHNDGEITINNADDYAAKLRDAHVLVDHGERQDIIREGAAKAANAAGLSLIEDEGLVIENAGLTEWPVPLLGRFDDSFLDVPAEVIQLTARVNQKYFVVNDAAGKLTNAFVCTANIDASDGGDAIVAGNEKVLAARLGDAKFFWDLDQKTTLADHAKGLERITFHEKLGTVADKVERVTNIAADRLPELVGWSESKAREMQPLLRQASKLAKSDLVTEMVGEFSDLQGLMGGYYARLEGLPVADAIRDHYKPVGQGDGLPSNEIGTLVSLADKSDTLFSFFLIDEKPTGSKDPFALRRAALGVIRLIVDNDLRLSLNALFQSIDWGRLYDSKGVNYPDPTDQLVSFIIDRLKVQQKEAGVRHDLIDAVFALGGEDDLVRLLARVKALQSFAESDDGANLLAGYKRAANILKQADDADAAAPAPAPFELAAEEAALLSALETAEPQASAAIQAEKFGDAMSALASLRTPIDAFFENVMVNDQDAAKRAFRLGLLARFRNAVSSVADFSKIEG